ncbi:MAG: OmpH family outer membrane protein [Bacteroidota bacterium]
MKNQHTDKKISELTFLRPPILYIFLVGIFLTGLAMGLLPTLLKQDKFAHINTEKVFNSFSLTQEYQSRISNLSQSRKSILENLQLRLQDMESRNVSQDSLQMAFEQLRDKEESFAADEQREIQQYNEQVLTQLKQYIQDFCEEKGYTYLFGSGESGNLLGANPEVEVTEELIAFINQKYRGEG